jgi:hypothetical protein
MDNDIGSGYRNLERLKKCGTPEKFNLEYFLQFAEVWRVFCALGDRLKMSSYNNPFINLNILRK